MSANGQSKSARNFHFLRRLQAGHWGEGGGGGWYQKLTPSFSLTFIQQCFTVRRLKSHYGYITRSNMLQYEVYDLYNFLANVQSLAARCNGQN